MTKRDCNSYQDFLYEPKGKEDWSDNFEQYK